MDGEQQDHLLTENSPADVADEEKYERVIPRQIVEVGQQGVKDIAVHLFWNWKKTGSDESKENNRDEGIDDFDQARADHHSKSERIFHA